MKRYLSLGTLIINTSFSLIAAPALGSEIELTPAINVSEQVSSQTSQPTEPEATIPEQNEAPAETSEALQDLSLTTNTELIIIDQGSERLQSPAPTQSNKPESNARETVSELVSPFIEGIVVVPNNTAMVFSFPNDTQVTVQKDGRSILAVPLAQPLLDHLGHQAIPSGSILQLQFSSVENEIQMSATDLVISGQVVPIQTSSVPLGSVSLRHTPRSSTAPRINHPWGHFQLGRYGTPPFSSSPLSTWSHTLSTTAELMIERTSHHRTHVVNIPAQSTFVLTLQEDIFLATRANN